MKIGDKVKITVGDFEYLDVIIGKNTVTDMWLVSVQPEGKVVESDGADLKAL